jgi:hypothetical protein
MSANTPRSRKAKGREFQKDIRKKILEIYPELEEDDVKCALMSEGGEDIKLSPAARKLIPYSIEAKRQEKLNIWDAIKQAEDNSKEGITPVVIFRRNHSIAYAVIPAEHFFQLVSKKTVE